MSAAFGPGQAKLLRALGIYLSNRGEISVSGPPDRFGFVVVALRSSDWASLTFIGERHHIVVRLPVGTDERAIDATAIDVPERIVAVERAAWASRTDGVVLTLDLLTVRGADTAADDARGPSRPTPPTAKSGGKSRSFRDLV